MDRRNNKPAFIAANDKLLEAEASKQQNNNTNTQAEPIAPTPPQAAPTPNTIPVVQEAPNTTPADNGNKGTVAPPVAEVATPKATELTDEVFLTHMRQKTGNDKLTMDEMLSAINKPENLTPEQQKQNSQEQELQLQSAFIKSGKGSIDDFYRIRQLKNVKNEDLVKEAFFAETKELDGNLDDDEISELFKEQYFIGEQYTETQQKIGQKRLKNEADTIRENMGMTLAQTEEELKMNDKAIKSANDWTKRVDNFTTKLPQSFQVPIGKIGEKEVGDFTYTFSEEEQREIVESLKDPAYLLKEIADKTTGQTDISKLYNLVVGNKVLRKIVKAAAGDYYSKGVDSIASVLNNNPNLTGNGGRETVDQTAERTKGEEIVRTDARKTFGRGPVVKSL